MKESIEKYKKRFENNNASGQMSKRMDNLSKFLSKLRYGQERHGTLIFTPTAVTSVRGTQYAINVKDASGYSSGWSPDLTLTIQGLVSKTSQYVWKVRKIVGKTSSFSWHIKR